MTDATQTHDHELGDDAPARYIDSQGRVIYRASAIGRCARALVAAARGETAQPWPADFQAILDEGKRLEATIIRLWEFEHPEMVVSDRQKRVELEVMDDVLVVGHIDGLTYRELDNCLVEVKKVRDSGWDDFLTRGVEMLPTYPWQVAFDMHALGIQDCAFIGGRCNSEGIITEVHTHWLTAPPLPLKAIVKRVRELERIIGAGFGPMEVECRGDYPCPYYLLHDEKPEDEEGVAFIVPRELTTSWAKMVADFSAVDEELKVLKKKVGERAALKEGFAESMRKMIEEMGAEAKGAKEIHGRDGAKLVVKRVRYDRKAYEVKAAKVDYFQVVDKHRKANSKADDE